MALHFIAFMPGALFEQAVALFGQPTHQHPTLVPAITDTLAPGDRIVWANYGHGQAACLPPFLHYTAA